MEDINYNNQKFWQKKLKLLTYYRIYVLSPSELMIYVHAHSCIRLISIRLSSSLTLCLNSQHTLRAIYLTSCYTPGKHTQTSVVHITTPCISTDIYPDHIDITLLQSVGCCSFKCDRNVISIHMSFRVYLFYQNYELIQFKILL